jgi:N-acetylmuramoyl-L-alanine amidase CwlA
MDNAGVGKTARFIVIEKLIRRNRSGKFLRPEGIVVHSTATPGATDTAEQKYFDTADRRASAHYFVDWDSITRCVPENEEAWHAGKTANSKFLSVEMCEPKGYDGQRFQTVWDRTVWLVADACVRYGWEIDSVWSHEMVSKTWHESTHTDPTGYLRSYGRSFDQLKQAVQQEIVVLSESATADASADKNAVKNEVDQEIVDNRGGIINLENAAEHKAVVGQENIANPGNADEPETVTAQHVEGAVSQENTVVQGQEVTTSQETAPQSQNKPLKNSPQNNPKSNPQNDPQYNLQDILQNYIRYRVTIEMDGQSQGSQDIQGFKNFESFESFERSVHGYLIEHFKIDYVLYGDGTSNLLSAICTEESMKQIKEAVEYCGGRVSIERV